VGAYYFLAAQLPYLIYGQNIPMSSADFKELARKKMDSSEAAVLDYCTLDPDPPAAERSSTETEPDAKPGYTYAKPPSRTSSAFVNRWKDWERALRLNLGRGRALKFKREGEAVPEAPDQPVDAVAAAKNAQTIESPLEAEFFLDKARWSAIESFQGMNIFSENAIYAYLLKLQLMERRMAFNTEEGFTEYKGLYAAILGEQK
jgi:hypothetical protein